MVLVLTDVVLYLSINVSFVFNVRVMDIVSIDNITFVLM